MGDLTKNPAKCTHKILVKVHKPFEGSIVQKVDLDILRHPRAAWALGIAADRCACPNMGRWGDVRQ